MTARPILFAAPMVRALLEDRKTQTRRVVKPQPYVNGYKFTGQDILCHEDNLPPSAMLLDIGRGANRYTTSDLEGRETSCPFGVPGDLLWVRETWLPRLNNQAAIYRADWTDLDAAGFAGMYSDRGWRPSIHMPRWASRLTLKITDVRVQRVKDIDGLDAIAEGITRVEGEAPWRTFRRLWDSLHQDDEAFLANPWVWALTFEVLHANVDAVEAKP